MAKNSRPEFGDFWDDCIKNELPEKKKNINKKQIISKSNSYTAFNNNIKKRKNMGIFLQNHKLIKRILNTEESIPKKNKIKEEKQIKILLSLYNKDISDKKRVEKQLIELREKKYKEELKTCSFKPHKRFKKNKTYDEAYEKNFGKKNIYERNEVYKNKFEKKINELKNEEFEEEEENIKFTFKPEIIQKNINKVLYINNFWEKRANNFSKKIFLWRYMKARKDESDKRKRLIWNKDKNSNYDLGKNKNNILQNNRFVHRSISQKDSLLYKKYLHFSLLDFKTNNEENNSPNNINIFIKQ